VGTRWDRAEHWVTEHLAALLGLSLLGLSLLGGAVYWRHQRAQQRELTSQQLSQALKAYQKDPAQALKALRALAQAHPSTPEGRLACWYEGRCLMRMGKYREAIPAYRRFLKAAPDSLRGLAQAELGRCYEELGQYKEALRCYRAELAADLEPIAYLDLGRCYEAMGKRLEALAAYRRAAEGFQGSPLAEWARLKACLLEEHGVSGPAKAGIGQDAPTFPGEAGGTSPR